MRKSQAVATSFVFLLLVPGTVAGVVPWLISGWEFQHASLLFRTIGVLLILSGIVPVLDSFWRFAWKGLGTPAPLAPARHLVVGGFYRYVRNPMYVGVVAMIVGQALLFGNRPLLIYAGAVWLAMHGFVVLYEEQKLRRTFGEEYATFCRHVPRWIPRRLPG